MLIYAIEEIVMIKSKLVHQGKMTVEPIWQKHIYLYSKWSLHLESISLLYIVLFVVVVV